MTILERKKKSFIFETAFYNMFLYHHILYELEHTDLTNLMLKVVSVSRFLYFDTGYTILKLWYSVLKCFCYSN